MTFDRQDLPPSSRDNSEDRFIGVSVKTLQELAFQHASRGNDIEVLQIERALDEQLKGLEVDDPAYDETLRAHSAVSELVNGNITKIQYSDLDKDDSESTKS